MSQPLQLWIPRFNQTPHFSAVRRDMHRAHLAWQGEDRIWLLPGITEPFRWYQSSGPLRCHELAIPSETFDCIDILHVDEQRRVHTLSLSLPLFTHTKQRLPPHLYRQWLNCGGPIPIGAPERFQGAIPVRKAGTVVFAPCWFSVIPGSPIPITQKDEATGHIVAQWPPPGSGRPSPISPEAESLGYLGIPQIKRLSAEEIDLTIVHTEAEKSHGPLILLHWPAPFDQLLSPFCWTDTLLALAKMQELLRSEKSPSEQWREARELATPYLSAGESSVGLTWFSPRVWADGVENALADVETRFNIVHSDLGALLRDPQVQTVLKQPAAVQRIWGWVGYFWWEVLADLKRGRSFRQCARCGQVIVGTTRKTFCSREENLQCFQARRAADKRRERTA